MSCCWSGDHNERLNILVTIPNPDSNRETVTILDWARGN